MKKPYAIIIMDGYGISKNREGNAIELEGSPNVKSTSANILRRSWARAG